MPLKINNRDRVQMIVYRSENNNFERIEASVKWYNPEKGYGFLTLDNGSLDVDIMIHFSVLDAVQCPYVNKGDRVICDVGPGKCGLHVIRVIEVKFESVSPRSLSDYLNPTLPEAIEEIEGTIKWYNPDKGYGFILPNNRTAEIFLHSSVLRRTGHKILEPGTRVLAKVFLSEKGPEARQIIILTSLQSEDQDGAHEQSKRLPHAS